MKIYLIASCLLASASSQATATQATLESGTKITKKAVSGARSGASNKVSSTSVPPKHTQLIQPPPTTTNPIPNPNPNTNPNTNPNPNPNNN